jgi:hypothetical protein
MQGMMVVVILLLVAIVGLHLEASRPSARDGAPMAVDRDEVGKEE